MIQALPFPETDQLRFRPRPPISSELTAFPHGRGGPDGNGAGSAQLPAVPSGLGEALVRAGTTPPAASPEAYVEQPVLTADGKLAAVRRDYAGRCGAADDADGFRAAEWTVRYPRARLGGALDILAAGLRRAGDLAAAIVGLALTLPFYPLFITMVLWRAPGPIFYRARRQTRGGTEFGCLKFRTMTVDADRRLEQLRAANEVDGPQFKMTHDPRVTPRGRILRALNLDELPQFFNVLAGTMSLVGPRPSPDFENRQCPSWREARLSVRPGITGLWQVNRTRDAQAGDFAEWIRYDAAYVRRRSIWQDLRIVLATIPVVFPIGKLARKLLPRLRDALRRRTAPTQT